MRRIAHLSDLHFGRVDPAIVEGAVEDVAQAEPDLVVVSGDLTQRARRAEFDDAASFLARMPGPVLVVPGNHDVPLYDVARRFLAPLKRYRAKISAELYPRHEDEEIHVLGINTARSFTWKDGAVDDEQLAIIRAWGHAAPPGAFRVLVTHHPFLPPEARPTERIVGGADRALRAAQEAGVELLLAGHLHEGYTGDARAHHVTLERSILVAQAGTATSTRTRGEVNTYNLIEVDPRAPRVAIEVRSWNGARFEATLRTIYTKDSAGAWERAV